MQRSDDSSGNEAAVVLESFLEAWNAHDLDALMSLMSDDCVYRSSAGPEPFGSEFRGRAEVRRGYAEILARYPDARWTDGRHLVDGEHGISEWVFVGTNSSEGRVEVCGCDLFELSGGRIRVKNSFRKLRTEG